MALESGDQVCLKVSCHWRMQIWANSITAFSVQTARARPQAAPMVRSSYGILAQVRLYSTNSLRTFISVIAEQLPSAGMEQDLQSDQAKTSSSGTLQREGK